MSCFLCPDSCTSFLYLFHVSRVISCMYAPSARKEAGNSLCMNGVGLLLHSSLYSLKKKRYLIPCHADGRYIWAVLVDMVIQVQRSLCIIAYINANCHYNHFCKVISWNIPDGRVTFKQKDTQRCNDHKSIPTTVARHTHTYLPPYISSFFV